MKLQGSHLLPAKPQEVWNLLTDPERLAKCLPGCERLEPLGNSRYSVVLKLGLAAISGSYRGSVELTDLDPPKSYRMKVEGKGAAGFMRGEGRIELSEKRGKTEVRYEGEAHVGGMIAAVGQRMIEAAARRILRQFFESAVALLNPSKSACKNPSSRIGGIRTGAGPTGHG